jgi:3-methyladenine DNA glycosylase AlkC
LGADRGGDGLKTAAIDSARAAAIDRGESETRNLAECLAVDQVALLRTLAPACADDFAMSVVGVGIARKMAIAGETLFCHLPPAALSALTTHRSDTVRGWSAFAIAAVPGPTLAQRFDAIRPLADDGHFGVREWAWLALRPHIGADIDAAIALLAPWCSERSEYLRRFASEATRPRGVWSAHIEALKTEPARGLPILEPLRADPARYVQDSVGNWLNDAAKSRPEWVRALCARWRGDDASEATTRICVRAQRSLDKSAAGKSSPKKSASRKIKSRS